MSTMNNQIPRVIDPADVRVGDLIEVTSTEHPDSKIIDRVKERFGTAIRCQWSYWTTDRSDGETFRLLDRPEPPKPELSTADDVDASVAWAGYRKDYHPNPKHLTAAHKAFLAGWAAAKTHEPANEDSDGLRERIEKLVEDFESLPHSTGTGRYIAHNLRAALTETSAPADGLRGRLEKLVGELDARPDILTTYAALATKVREALTDGAEQ